MATPVLTPPNTTTMTNHGLLIRVNGANDAIGAIFKWAPRKNRGAQAIYEFGSVTKGRGVSNPARPGEPYEQVPGNSTNHELTISRYDIFSNRMETAFGTKNLVLLTRQDEPITLIEFWNTPNNEFDFTNIYEGCWFTSIGREHSADGNRIVMANATLVYTTIQQL